MRNITNITGYKSKSKSRRKSRRRSRRRSRSGSRFKKIKGGTINPINDVLGIFDSAKYQVSSAASTFNIKPAAELNPTYPIDPNPGNQFL